MSRKIARELVYKLIFEYVFGKADKGYTFELIMYDKDLGSDDKKYITSVYQGVIEKYDELSEYIAKFAIGYSYDRIVKADKAALLLAVFEMKYMKDIPLSVSINEAVDIVKRFSTEKSSSFVNGILASVYKDIKGDK